MVETISSSSSSSSSRMRQTDSAEMLANDDQPVVSQYLYLLPRRVVDSNDVAFSCRSIDQLINLLALL